MSRSCDDIHPLCLTELLDAAIAVPRIGLSIILEGKKAYIPFFQFLTQNSFWLTLKQE